MRYFTLLIGLFFFANGVFLIASPTNWRAYQLKVVRIFPFLFFLKEFDFSTFRFMNEDERSNYSGHEMGCILRIIGFVFLIEVAHS